MIYLRHIHFFTIFTLCLSCEPSAHPVEPYHLRFVEENVYAHFDSCNFTIRNPKVVINPYKNDLANLVQPKPFSSCCLKCAACLAVATEIAKTIAEAKLASSIRKLRLESANQELVNHVNLLCTKGFRNFDLRKYNEDISLITNKLLCTEHIRINMDESWTKKLREKCSLYSHYMDLNTISNGFGDSLEELPNTLCRSTGIFRDCLNVEYDRHQQILSEMSNCNPCTCK